MQAKISDDALCQQALSVIDIEATTIGQLRERIGENFVQACHTILSCTGRVVLTGIGKSGLIARKISATLSSTGTPSFFLHPGEASHGDLGMLTSHDVVIALSNSGETPEIVTILPLIKRLAVPLIAMTGAKQSTLAQRSSIHLDITVEREACPLGLAPTSSTTAALVMGDALAIALLSARGFTSHDFALSHPGGSLGRRLLLLVSDIMHTSDRIPAVAENALLTEALMEMTQKELGMTAIIDTDRKIRGIFTDGDLRRLLEGGLQDFHNQKIKDIMTPHCITIAADQLAAEAMQLMQARKINALLVTDDQHRLCGALNMHDLIRAGIV